MEKRGGMISIEENSLFVHQSSLTILPVESSSSKQEEREKEMNFALRNAFVHTTQVIFYMSYDMGLPALLPLGRKAYCGFYRP
jgi:hypothetical protein